MLENSAHVATDQGLDWVVRHEEAGVVELCLNRSQKRNALSYTMLRQLELALEAAVEARAIVLSASGPVFSAGIDIADLHGDERDVAIDRRARQIAQQFQAVSVPTIAAVDGPCIGAALELILACDGWVFSPSGSLSLPSVRMGLLYDPTTVARLQQRIGAAAVSRMVVMQEPLRAHELGALAVLAEGQAEARPARDRAISIARAIAGQPPGLVSGTKAMLYGLAAGGNPEEWAPAHVASFRSETRAAAVAAARARVRGSGGRSG